MSQINGFIGRRDLLKFVGVMGIGAVAFGHRFWDIQQAAAADVHSVNPNPVSPNEAIRRLLNGNQRFVHQQRKYPDQTLEHLRLVAKAQYPFAAILGCADSRVPAEIVFDQGLGDLFVVRVAGNVASDTAIGSLEYSTAVLGSQLIVVLGHKRCGAVAEAIKNEPLPGRIGFVVEGIKPALANLKLTTDNTSDEAVKANVKYQAKKLQESSGILAKLLDAGKLKIVGACYDIDTGKVNLVNG
ncbi:carbonic anhydrase [Nostoc linckia z18]|uniref:carbonic anhydrase n=2 Tax=Nostoc linckia TaxID=92942 RepID=A0A9Q5ZFK0_NOSLI|nr:carbonic anhydrase [Nostoc linckia]PHK41852.1 carbonic anhydrase [Nostoc linckia z15]PHK47676.1 carbonic anhydrase [Nostoc linckia z16]PHJ59952.1 carbonic anhydrase [Nostoc linckia z1]PHJ67128.1 carbonic anhydrase [Nostoc linckia z3]PHJ69858.1 carbonic anhydrase [Nostoc linckia z2]